MSDRLVTISMYRLESEAFLAKGALEAAGIDAVLVGQYSASNLPHESFSGGYSLQVAAEDAEHADAILNQIHGVAHAEYVRPSDADDAAPPSRCERCGSPEVRKVQKLTMFGVLAILITAVFIAVDQAMWIFYSVIAAGIFTLLAARWQCRNCGYRW